MFSVSSVVITGRLLDCLFFAFVFFFCFVLQRIWPKDDFCDPMEEMPDGVLLNPCGLIANSMFNGALLL